MFCKFGSHYYLIICCLISPIGNIMSAILEFPVGKLWPLKIQNKIFCFGWFQPKNDLFILLNYIKILFHNYSVWNYVLRMTQCLTRNVSQCSVHFQGILWRIPFPIMCQDSFLFKLSATSWEFHNAVCPKGDVACCTSMIYGTNCGYTYLQLYEAMCYYTEI